jgi:hypothetical protein
MQPAVPTRVRQMVRFHLRAFLLGSALVSALVGLYLRERWDPIIRSHHEEFGARIGPPQYNVTWFSESKSLGGYSLLGIRVSYGYATGHAGDWKVGPSGVFFRGERPARCQIYLMRDNGEFEKIPLAPDDYDDLEQITSEWLKIETPGDMTAVEWDQFRKEKAAQSPGNSKVWKTKVEPIILPIIAEQHRQWELEHRAKVLRLPWSAEQKPPR